MTVIARVQSQLLDPIMVKYEHDVMTSADSDVIAPDSQMHVTSSTVPSPYTNDLNAEVCVTSL